MYVCMYQFSGFFFYGIPKTCVNKWVSVSFLVLSPGLFSFCFVLSKLLVFVLAYYIIFYYYSLETCSIMRDKRAPSEWEGRSKGTGRSRGRKNSSQNILCEGKNSFSIKGGK